MSDTAQRIESARRKHASAVLEYQSNPCSTTFQLELAARRELESEVQRAKMRSVPA